MYGHPSGHATEATPGQALYGTMLLMLSGDLRWATDLVLVGTLSELLVQWLLH